MIKWKPVLSLAMLALPLVTSAQSVRVMKENVVRSAWPLNWHMLSWPEDSVYGTAINKVYHKLGDRKQPQKIIVAVMDSGIDTAHEDLRNVLWINTKEIPGNGIDDDGNGYTDDIHGWNFIGSTQFVSKESDREYVRLLALYAGKDTAILPLRDKIYLRSVMADSKIVAAEKALANAKLTAASLLAIKAEHSAKTFLYSDLLALTPATTDASMKWAVEYLKMYFSVKKMQPDDTLRGIADMAGKMVSDAERQHAQLLAAAKPNGVSEPGNNILTYNTALHGTHVSGIIGAERHNSLGIDGMADVTIMGIRIIPPGGDEYDEEVAAAIRYAVDNGAGIINMSFGKLISPNKKIVDEAIRYAGKKGVLIVHAAGNDGMNTDTTPFYPSRFYTNGQLAENMITVGGSDAKGALAGISNYGKKSVDVFAPSHSIYSTGYTGGGKSGYFLMDGTSVSAPVVTGVAALLRSWYPQLTPAQVRDILIKSVTPIAAFKDISVSGGIVNAGKAMQLAEKLTVKR